jgi:hypothetical protein
VPLADTSGYAARAALKLDLPAATPLAQHGFSAPRRSRISRANRPPRPITSDNSLAPLARVVDFMIDRWRTLQQFRIRPDLAYACAMAADQQLMRRIGVAKQVLGNAEGASKTFLSESQSAAINSLARIVVKTLTAEQKAIAIEQVTATAWASESHMAAALEFLRPKASMGPRGLPQRQNFEMFPLYFSEDKWDIFRDVSVSQSIKIQEIFHLFALLELDVATEGTWKRVTSFAFSVSCSPAALNRVPRDSKVGMMTFLKRAWKEKRKQMTQHHFVPILPASPAALLESHPELYRRAFGDGHPALCKIAIDTLITFESTFKCRSHPGQNVQSHISVDDQDEIPISILRPPCATSFINVAQGVRRKPLAILGQQRRVERPELRRAITFHDEDELGIVEEPPPRTVDCPPPAATPSDSATEPRAATPSDSATKPEPSVTTALALLPRPPLQPPRAATPSVTTALALLPKQQLQPRRPVTKPSVQSVLAAIELRDKEKRAIAKGASKTEKKEEKGAKAASQTKATIQTPIKENKKRPIELADVTPPKCPKGKNNKNKKNKKKKTPSSKTTEKKSDDALLSMLEPPRADDCTQADPTMRKKKLNAYQSRCYAYMSKLVKDRPQAEIKRLRSLAHAKAKEIFEEQERDIE